MKTIATKSREMTEVHAQFVSLVDAAANKHIFAIAKADGNNKNFEQKARIILKNADSHYVTGVVYEPMTEDTQGDFMTAEEIQKAAYWYMKNAQCVDVQHSFESEPGACVVESWVEKGDIVVGGQDIKAGTWMMTMEITDDDLWSAVEKGSITGFSIGGTCIYGDDDVDLEKNKATKGEDMEDNNSTAQNAEEKTGFLVKMANFLGLSNIIKGDVTDLYNRWNKGSSFWNAMEALEDSLRKWDSYNECYVYQTDEVKIKEALMEFSAIITDILADDTEGSVIKAVSGPKDKAERAEKSADDALASIRAAHEQLTAVNKGSDSDTNNKEKEESEVNKAEVEAIIKAELAKAGIIKAEDGAETEAPAPETPETQAEEVPAADDKPEVTEPETPAAEAPAEVTQEAVEKMVADAVAKAMQPVEEKLTMDQVAEIVNKAVAEAVEPIKKHTGVPSNLNGETVEKQAERHYLAGIL